MNVAAPLPASARDSEPLPMKLKLVHGSGAVAFGVKDNGFSVFLLIFYNQVLGMEASLVSLALMLALVIDAFIDPMLGNLSDRTYTKWGRRLPWLYAAALPLAIAWTVLWSPSLDGVPTFWQLLAVAVAVRLCLSAVEVPSAALVPELTLDYDERTDLFRYRALFGWMGGLLMLLLAYQVFLKDGLLEAEGYAAFGLFGAGLMLVATVFSALGQHRRIAHLPAVKPPPFSLKVAFSEIREAFAERAFLILAAGAVAAYIGQGLTFAFTNYLYLYVWQFGTGAFVYYPLVLFASIVAVFVSVGAMHRRWGKAKAAAWAAIIGVVLWLTPYTLFLAGLWPEAGSTLSTSLVFIFLFFANWMTVTTLLSSSSMVAEIVEAFQQRTGRRAEGSFYSGNWFVQKCAGGVGIFLAGLILDAAGLPAGAEPGSVASAVLDRMVLYYGVISLVLAIIAAFWFARFPISRADHEERLSALDAAARGNPASTVTTP